MTLDLAAGIAALRGAAALVDHGTRFLARLSGKDVLPWLERLASLSVLDLAPRGLRAVTLMDGKGRLRADPRVLAPTEPSAGLLLDLPASERVAVLRLLGMYVIHDDVQVEDLGASHGLISVAGPGAAGQLARAGLPVPEGEGLAAAGGLLVAPCELSGCGGFDLLGPLGDIAAARARLVDAGLPQASPAALDVVRVAAGVPWFGPDLSAGVIPLEARLDRKVSSTKGCYPGQEVVARIVNLGQVARKLMTLSAAGQVELPPRSELSDTEGKAVGLITSLAFDPSCGRTLALGYLRRSHWSEGSSVTAGGITFRVGPSRA